MNAESLLKNNIADLDPGRLPSSFRPSESKNAYDEEPFAF